MKRKEKWKLMIEKGDGMMDRIGTEKILAMAVLLMMCVAGAGFGATAATSTSTSAAVLQVADTSTVPATVYPGTSGYAKLTLQNTGQETATGMTVYYSDSQSFLQQSMPGGDISAGSTSQITIPFKMPNEVAGGIYTIKVDIYYTSASISGVSKLATASIPIIASQYGTLEVTTGEGNKVVAPGETLQLDIAVKNKGGVVNNLVVSVPENSSFTLEGTTEKSLGNVPTDSTANVTLRLTSSSSATVGKYTIPLVFTYQDALGASSTQTLYVGPVSILEPSTQYRMSMEPGTPTEVGGQAVFDLKIENTGTNQLNAIVDVNSTGAFTPLGVTRIYFDTLEAGESASKNVTLGISNSITAGYYTLPLTITLGSGKSATQYIGIPVTATPELVVSATTTPAYLTPGSSGGKVLVQISNIGNAAIRSVYVTANRGDLQVTSSTDKFVGTLNVDDFSTFQLDVNVPRNLAAGTHSIQVTISFKDTNNVPHVVNKSVDIQVYDSATAAAAGQDVTNSTGGFGGRSRNQGVIFGLGWVQIGGIVIGLGVAGYFVRRHLLNKRKAERKKGLMA
ncbi:NPCBM-associated, NEW3 domain of alpha-galactosidase [Candidatus Gugararchaeum adminiculabundum]|nr:NPCBM-associated, NEW3 domain of alpha-galactosidase [Candidatus Gugararchaeum adminiculabundum]